MALPELKVKSQNRRECFAPKSKLRSIRLNTQAGRGAKHSLHEWSKTMVIYGRAKLKAKVKVNITDNAKATVSEHAELPFQRFFFFYLDLSYVKLILQHKG